MSARDNLIERVDVFGYELTYAHGDYVMSGGRVVNRLPSTVVRITTRGGLQGYGETCPLGATYLPAFAEGARAALRELAPALLGLDAANLAGISARMDETLRGQPYAKSAIDVACWDVIGRACGQPAAMLLGGMLQPDLPLYVAIPMGPPADMAAFVVEERRSGVHRFQLKLGDDPERDAARVAAVVDATGPEDAVVADANGGWRRQDALIAARLLERYPRVRLEQPCPTFEESLAVRRLCSLPMVLDEVITDLPALVRAVGEDAMDQINLKISRVGGLTKARAIRDTAVDLGLRLMIEDTWGGDIVTAAVAHLAAATPPESLFAVSFMNDWTMEHVAGYAPRSHNGRGPVPTGPGLGIEVDETSLGTPLFTARP
jgi:L-alanine-DL-glutamate epimerase-like enolase superfamily enzyme